MLAEAEKKGIPGVALVYDTMLNQLEGYSTSLGIPNGRFLIYGEEKCTGPDGREYAKSFMPQVVAALTEPPTEEELKTGIITPKPLPRIVFTGTWEEVQEFFAKPEQYDFPIPPQPLMTDGLPIIPPTEQNVAQMLTGTSHDPNEVIDVRIAPAQNRVVTVEKVAINAVMAGCSPEQLPILLAAISASDKAGHCSGAGHSGMQWVVSGPIAQEVGMNAWIGFLGPFNAANSCLGRAYFFATKNLGNAILGITHGHTTGNPMDSTMWAEDTPNSPWKGLNEELGYREGQSVIFGFTAQRMHLYLHKSSWYRAGNDAVALLAKKIVEMKLARPLIMIEAAMAGKEGSWYGRYTKEDLKKAIYDEALITIGEFKKDPFDWYLTNRYVNSGRWEYPTKEMLTQPDETIIHFLSSPDDITIVVAGEPTGIHSSLLGIRVDTAYAPPVIKVALIDKWR